MGTDSWPRLSDSHFQGAFLGDCTARPRGHWLVLANLGREVALLTRLDQAWRYSRQRASDLRCLSRRGGQVSRVAAVKILEPVLALIPDGHAEQILQRLEAALCAAPLDRNAASEDALTVLRRELQVDENGDGVSGADPLPGWETGYCAGIRTAYRALKRAAPQVGASGQPHTNAKTIGGSPAVAARSEGPDFNQEVNLHADTIAERHDERPSDKSDGEALHEMVADVLELLEIPMDKWFTLYQRVAELKAAPLSAPPKPSESPTPRTDDFLCVVSGAKGGPHYGMLDVEEPWPQYKGLADFARQLERELAEELEKKREVFIALHDRALKAEADLASAIANHAADLSARSATAPRWISWAERKPPDNIEVLVTPGYAEEISIDRYVKEYDSALMRIEDGRQPTHWMPLPSVPVDSGGAK